MGDVGAAMIHLVLNLLTIALSLWSITLTLRTRHERLMREAGSPYRSLAVPSPIIDTKLPFGSKCPKCGKRPNTHEVYESEVRPSWFYPGRPDRIRQQCKRNYDYSDTYGCGYVWYERPRDAEVR